MDYKVNKSDKEWKAKLTEEEFRILRMKGTERAFTGKYDKSFEEGTYSCAACDFPLFDSEHKFNSGCGWPAFWGELESATIEQKSDHSFGMTRVELLCSNCGGHLGHIFPDGPAPSGKRYCINSASMAFTPRKVS